MVCQKTFPAPLNHQQAGLLTQGRIYGLMLSSSVLNFWPYHLEKATISFQFLGFDDLLPSVALDFCSWLTEMETQSLPLWRIPLCHYRFCDNTSGPGHSPPNSFKMNFCEFLEMAMCENSRTAVVLETSCSMLAFTETLVCCVSFRISTQGTDP